ncbi:MAG: clostripain-related cysteine peptidase [Candidatus Sericytochromatia bacterium]
MVKKLNLFLAFSVALLSVSACNPSNPIDSIENETSEALQNKNNITVPADNSILPQIKSSTIEQTEWGVNVKALPTIKTQKKATVLSYMGFDNDKGSFRDELRQMINFHELSGSSSVMNMLLQTDSADKRDLKRYLIVPDSNTSQMASPYTSFKYERDSADYRVLSAFIRWGFSTYPSQIKMLDIDSHGGAFYGAVRDDDANKIIGLPNIATAIKNGTGKVNILNFDACLMGAMEVLYELKDTTDIMIGSEDSTLGTGMLYTKSLPSIIAGSKTAEEIGRKIVLASDTKGSKDFLLRPNKKGKIPNVYTIAAYRANKVADLATQLDKLAKMVLNNLSSQKQAIKVALSGTHPLHVDEDDLGGERDLFEVLSRIEFTNSDANIKAQAKATRDALNKVIVIARINNNEKNAQGMAINISPDHMASNEYKSTAFAKNTSWDEMIIAVNK